MFTRKKRRSFKQMQGESDEQFLNRIISQTFSPRDEETQIMHYLRLMIENVIKDAKIADMLMQIFMVQTGNVFGLIKNKKGDQTAEEIFAEYVVEIFTPRYCLYLQNLMKDGDKDGTLQNRQG